MTHRTVVMLFALGWAVGIPLAWLYIAFSPSQDRVFHGFVMLAACGVSFPAVTIFLNITLKMWDKAIEQAKVLSDLRDEIKPLVHDAKAVIKSVEDMMGKFGDQPKVIVDFIDRLSRDGTVEKFTTSFDTIVKKIHSVIDRSGPSAGATRDDVLKEMGGAKRDENHL